MPETVLLLRSGRHLPEGVLALRRALPGCDISVMSPPDTDHHLVAAGIPIDRRLVYSAPRFSAWHVLRSGMARRVRHARFQRVAMLSNCLDGAGQANVIWTSVLLAPKGFLAVTPAGDLVAMGWTQPIATSWTRAGNRALGRIQAIASWWQHLRTRFEGPELEPRVWHSHFLSAWVAQRTLPALAQLLEGRVLDVGAGTGYAARFLSPRATYLPTDLPDGRDAADSTISTRGMRPVVQCSGIALPFRSATLDGVMAVSLLEHVPDPGAILREAYRALRPGARALLVTPFCFPFHGEPHDYRRWTADGLAHEAEASGFEIECADRLGASTTALVLNLHLLIKYQWRLSPAWWLRALAAAWPVWLVWQGLANLAAMAIDHYEPRPSLPLGVAVLARKPLIPGEAQ